MFVRAFVLSGWLATFALCGCAGQSRSLPTAPLAAHDPSLAFRVPAAPLAAASYRVCADAAPGHVACMALRRTDAGAIGAGPAADPAATPPGYTPADLHAAYGLPSSGGSGQTVGIVDIGDDPNAESDLGVYRTYFGLPACTSANACFSKVAQDGTTNYPNASTKYASETSLDLDVVSAVCPHCHILLVEAKNDQNGSVEIAENTAAKLGATEISNSFGGPEVMAKDPAYDHPGIVITASAGDGGANQPMQPAAYASVIAVGGTSLAPDGSSARGYSESAWPDSGSGCSALVAKPRWQTDSGCAMRTLDDIAFLANPGLGVAVYDSVRYYGTYGWIELGGTSVGAPAIAAAYALAGNAARRTAARGIWENAGKGLVDITTGSLQKCSPLYLCYAGVGYDGPTGWGTPDGLEDL